MSPDALLVFCDPDDCLSETSYYIFNKNKTGELKVTYTKT